MFTITINYLGNLSLSRVSVHYYAYRSNKNNDYKDKLSLNYF